MGSTLVVDDNMRWMEKAYCSNNDIPTNTFFEKLAEDDRIPLDKTVLNKLVSEPIEFAGDAKGQVERVCERIAALTKRHPQAAQYQPGEIR